jgi:hypothetical protein
VYRRISQDHIAIEAPPYFYRRSSNMLANDFKIPHKSLHHRQSFNRQCCKYLLTGAASKPATRTNTPCDRCGRSALTVLRPHPCNTSRIYALGSAVLIHSTSPPALQLPDLDMDVTLLDMWALRWRNVVSSAPTWADCEPGRSSQAPAAS